MVTDHPLSDLVCAMLCLRVVFPFISKPFRCSSAYFCATPERIPSVPCNSISDLFLAVLRSSVSILCQSHLSRSDSSTFGAIPQQLAACQFRTQPLPVPSLPHFVSLCHRHAVRLHSLPFLRFAILFVAAPRVTNASPSGSSRAIPQHSKLFRFLAVCFGSILIPRAAYPAWPCFTLAVLRGSGLSPSVAVQRTTPPISAMPELGDAPRR